MLKISTKGRYGVRLMLELAVNYGKGLVALKDVARRQEISEKYLEHLIVPLKKEKLIRSGRGARGGYMLAKDPGSISLREIIAAVEGPVCIAACAKNPSSCRRSRGCLSRRVWGELSEKISGILSGLTLKKIIEDKKPDAGEFCYAI